MALIAPINHYEYEQYRERDLKRIGNPFKLSAVYKVTPVGEGKFQGHIDQFASSDRPLSHKKPLVKNEDNHLKDIKQELTGKGRLFDSTA